MSCNHNPIQLILAHFFPLVPSLFSYISPISSLSLSKCIQKKKYSSISRQFGGRIGEFIEKLGGNCEKRWIGLCCGCETLFSKLLIGKNVEPRKGIYSLSLLTQNHQPVKYPYTHEHNAIFKWKFMISHDYHFFQLQNLGSVCSNLKH